MNSAFPSAPLKRQNPSVRRCLARPGVSVLLTCSDGGHRRDWFEGEAGRPGGWGGCPMRLGRRAVPAGGGSSTAMSLDLVEFPADDLARARRFWETLLDVCFDERREREGEGLQTHAARPSLGLHE